MVRAHQGAIRAFLRRLTGETALADDLAQISFLKAYEQRKTWLFQIAYRSFVDNHRKRARRHGLSKGHVQDEPPQAPSGLKMDIEAAMNTLPAECHAKLR